MTTTSRPARGRAISYPRAKGRGIDSGAGRTVADRAASGKAVREAVPLAAHAELPSDARREDPVALLERQSEARLPELIPVRYSRMSESPFRFYRGAAALMAADLAACPTTGLRAQLCGDAHMLNFRLLASPERQLIFDINDFDETLPGPFEWDVKRLAASLVIAGRANGYGSRARREIVVSAIASYRQWMRHFAALPTLAVWQAQGNTDRIQEAVSENLKRSDRKRLAASLKAARRRDNAQALRRLTVLREDGRHIVSDPPLLVPLIELIPDAERAVIEKALTDVVDRYAASLPSDRRYLIGQYHIVDMARKVVGVGSVGTRCWVILLVSRDDDDALLLQVKEASESVLAPFAGASLYSHSGQRVVTGQRLMQASSDIFLGWVRTEGIDGQPREFYVRQLRDWKGIAVPERMKPSGMRWFGAVAGGTLARAHAKSGDRVAIASYLGRGDAFEKALAEFAESYADQNDRDFAALQEAITSGRIPADLKSAS